MKPHLIIATALLTSLAIFGTTSPANAQVPPPAGMEALAFERFTGSGEGDWVAAAPGMGHLLINDVLELLKAGGDREDCPVLVVEWERRAEIIAEVELENSVYGDPATAARPGRMINPTIMVTGQSDFTNGVATITMELRTYPDGTLIATISDQLPEDSWMDNSTKLARDIVSAICPEPLWQADGGGPRIVITGQIAAYDKPFALQGEFPGAAVQLTYTPTSDVGGLVGYTFSGSGVGGSGSGTYTLSDQGDGTFLIEQTTNGCVEGIPNSCAQNSEKIVLTPISQ